MPNKNFSFLNIRKQIFFTLTAAVLILNLFFLTKETIKMVHIRQRAPYTFLGDRFRGLETLIGKAPIAGYYTDKNLDDKVNAMQLAQAQLILTPIILDLNNTGHEFVIFDCTSPAAALKKIKDIGAQPLKANRYGIILAHNPDRGTAYAADSVKTFDKKISRQSP